MRKTGVGIVAAVTLLAGCTSAAPAAQPAATTSGTDAHGRGIELVQTVVPGASASQAEDMMRTTCDLVKMHPNAAGVLAVRAQLVERGFGSAAEVTALIAASVAGTCPQYLPALPRS